MFPTSLGPWIAIAAAVAASARVLVVLIVLRGTKPKDRAEILRALPVFFLSLRRETAPPDAASVVESGSGGPAP